MDTRHARAAQLQGFSRVAGVDEVGRGPLAGPVVAAVCVLPGDADFQAQLCTRVRDSKALSVAAREELDALIRAHCAVSVAAASVAEIDALNIRQATHLAMRRALTGLQAAPDFALIDGHEVPAGLACPAACVVKGDAVELAIACASIVAKVHRDALMASLGRHFPHYGWARNAGYGTAAHLAALQAHGATPHHRTSFAPVAAVVQAMRQVA